VTKVKINAFTWWMAGALLLQGPVGCSRQEIRVYDVPKETAVASAALPEGWQQLAADEMRIGNYSVTGTNGAKAQVTVISLPGAAGGELENVNRWRKQVGLQPITADDLGKESREIQIAGAPARFFELSGVAPETKARTRLLAALQNQGDSTWFFKMMGDDGLVGEQKEAFLGFCMRYQYPGDRRQEIGDRSQETEDRAAAAGEALQEPAPRRTWKAPAGWQEQQPGPMQDGKFLVSGGKATVSISVLQGAAGGELANVNRWRTQQLGLPAVDEAGLAPLLTPLDLADTKANLVDMTGPKERMVAAIVPRGSQTWFFKMLGEEGAVGAEKVAFVEFVKSAK